MTQPEELTSEELRDNAIADVQGHVLAYLDSQISTEPAFAGCVIDEIKSEQGRLLGVRLVFCDAVGGNVARRL